VTTGRWGRWGPDDERGALNLVDAAATRRGLASVVEHRPLSLGLPIAAGSAPHADIRPDVQHLMLRDGGDYAAGLPERPGYGYADDMLVLACHGTTHLDALSHVWRDGQMWNGRPASEVSSRGARRAGIETTGPIATRGILVDLGDELSDSDPVTSDRLELALADAEVTPEAGDALLLRTGWLARWRAGAAGLETWPGFDASVADLVDRYDLALVGADTISTEVNPSRDPQCALPVHIALIRDRGVFLMELLDLEELAESAARTFLLVVSPLKIVGGSGSPVAPTAIL
jgi:kynurenine formamidase